MHYVQCTYCMYVVVAAPMILIRFTIQVRIVYKCGNNHEYFKDCPIPSPEDTVKYIVQEHLSEIHRQRAAETSLCADDGM